MVSTVTFNPNTPMPCPQYMERKRTLIKDGRWAKASQHSTQFHDVLGFHAGTFVRCEAAN